ncbi:glycosyltransferase family 4 protein [Modicisalibacter tunisiensis]|uniref:glycosyltransferase family 4 protein n=1 Tax=Modicisalibacter tunisiensis TaxID=390637 RepID=UPI001CCB1502|nr:glycosyltransferase family 4 protein [Modicisalibacter tunisiensis]
MDIIYLHQYFNTPSMQGSTRSYEMARRLVRRGHRVRMITSWREAGGKRDWSITHEDGIEVHWLPVPYDNSMGYRQRLQAFFRFAWHAGRRASRLPGDVLLATSTPLTIALPAVYASRSRDMPMVFEVRDLWPEMPIAIGALRHPLSIFLARRLERFAYYHAERVVALSPGMRDGVIETGYPPSQITVIPNSCDLELFAPDPSAGERFRALHPELGDDPFLLYAGTLGRVNGVEYLVHLAHALRKRRTRFKCVIIGAGSEARALHEIAMRLGVLDDNLFLYPPRTKQEIVDAFAAADMAASCFIDLPEMEKNSANKFFDALASGTPVAINYGGWQADLLNETGAGLVLSRDPVVAAGQLDDWFGDAEQHAGAGEAALTLARSRFSRDRLAEELEAVLQEAAHDSRVIA